MIEYLKAAVKDQTSGSFYELYRNALLDWYDRNRRELPWRDCGNPYFTWVSEIMLQQTRVTAVVDYFLRFTEALPDVKSLAECSEDRLLKLWEGLGYYSRVRNMKKAAVQIMEQHEGRIPGTYRELLILPGIGPYTAGAIASIAFQEPVPAVDGNVLRVAARVLGSHEPVNTDAFKSTVWELAGKIIPEDRPGDFNQAVMDLGAIVCLPNGEPLCGVCPLSGMCGAYAAGEAAALPVRIAKKKRKTVFLTLLLIQDAGRTMVQKRKDTGLLAGMYEFPNREGILNEEEALLEVKKMGYEPLAIEKLPDSSHIFTHVEWKMTAWLVSICTSQRGELPRKKGCVFADFKDSMQDYAIPSAFGAYQRYLKER